MKQICFVLFLIFIFFSGFSQHLNKLSFELAGSGGFGSFNFEKNLFYNEKSEPVLDELAQPKKMGSQLDLRIGFSLTPVDKNNGVVLIFPVMVHFHKFKGSHGIDVGLGQAFSITTRGNFFLRTPLSAGYRFQPLDKKYYLRFSYTPIFSYLLGFQYQHWAGITYGHTLGNK
ncbi:MAG: hypothetical protein IPM77_11905 [Crocinitomicaceae bacterium]|nr:hypothetical protein [Crocinitomicaceae bacterium]